MEEIWKNVNIGDITGEEWRDIKEYEGKYMVSSLGRVKSLNYRRSGKEEILEPYKVRGGYLMVDLRKNGKRDQQLVHRLVAMAFIPNAEGKPEVDHINNNGPKTDCRAVNLRWVTSRENKNNGRSKQVMCVETGKVYHSAMEAERQTGAHNAHIIRCCKGRYKTAKGFHWRYA